MKYFCLTFFALLTFFNCSTTLATNELKNEARLVLHQVASSEAFWVKVHAIEFMIELGYHEDARRYTNQNLAKFETVPQKRIGYWRCQYRLSNEVIERESWLNKIIAAYKDQQGLDRIHAAETLAKLDYSLSNPAFEKFIHNDLASSNDLAAYVAWGYSLANPSYQELFELLNSSNVNYKTIGAYACSFVKLTQEQTNVLAKLAFQESTTSKAFPWLISSTYMQVRKNNMRSLTNEVRAKLNLIADRNDKATRIAFCRALAESGESSDIDILKRYLRNENPLTALSTKDTPQEVKSWNEDVSVTAAFSILRLLEQ